MSEYILRCLQIGKEYSANHRGENSRFAEKGDGGMNCLKGIKKRYLSQKQNEEMLTNWYEFCKRADAIILYTLWQDFGFGRARLEKFYKHFLINSEELYLRYDNNHKNGEDLGDGFYAIDNTPPDERGRERYAIVRQWLKEQVGVDVEEWQKWDVEELMREEREEHDNSRQSV